MTRIWHNPRCSKSRQTLALLEERGIAPTIRNYLEDVPSETELREVLAMLGKSAQDIARKGEADYKDNGLKNASEDALIKAMTQYPKIIERPIVLHGNKAAIGRPPEAILEIL
ncbi:MAG: arsenate reductase (glutaredoxin) [Pseudomonadota bacterium]